MPAASGVFAKIAVIVDLDGNIIAAELPGGDGADVSEDEPVAHLIPKKGQRLIEMEIPVEVLDWSALSLYQFFSRVEVGWPSDVRMPEIETS